jgi:hypothetical protein
MQLLEWVSIAPWCGGASEVAGVKNYIELWRAGLILKAY